MAPCRVVATSNGHFLVRPAEAALSRPKAGGGAAVLILYRKFSQLQAAKS